MTEMERFTIVFLENYLAKLLKSKMDKNEDCDEGEESEKNRVLALKSKFELFTSTYICN
jgi:hypothetical protein